MPNTITSSDPQVQQLISQFQQWYQSYQLANPGVNTSPAKNPTVQEKYWQLGTALMQTPAGQAAAAQGKQINPMTGAVENQPMNPAWLAAGIGGGLLTAGLINPGDIAAGQGASDIVDTGSTVADASGGLGTAGGAATDAGTTGSYLGGVSGADTATSGDLTGSLLPSGAIPGGADYGSVAANTLPTDPNDPWATGTFSGPQYNTNPATTGGDAINQILNGSGNGQAGQNPANIASLLQSYANSQAANRIKQGQLTQGYDQLMLAAQANARANQTQGMKDLAQSAYIQQGGSHFKMPSSLNLGGQNFTVPDLGLEPPKISPDQVTGAGLLTNQALTMLGPGGNYQPQPLSGYATPGVGEQIGNYGQLGLAGLGILNSADPQWASQAGNFLGNLFS